MITNGLRRNGNILVVGMAGKMKSGKDTFFSTLESLMPYGTVRRVAFADDLKKEVSEQLHVPVETINENKDVFRPLLQWWGTEFRRKFFKNDNWWVLSMVRRIEHINEDDPFVKILVVTDIRFPNEVQMVKDMGGMLIRITRPQASAGLFPGLLNGFWSKPSYVESHSSETLLDGWNVDAEIVNNGSLDDLAGKIRLWLKTVTSDNGGAK